MSESSVRIETRALDIAPPSVIGHYVQILRGGRRPMRLHIQLDLRIQLGCVRRVIAATQWRCMWQKIHCDFCSCKLPLRDEGDLLTFVFLIDKILRLPRRDSQIAFSDSPWTVSVRRIQHSIAKTDFARRTQIWKSGSEAACTTCVEENMNFLFSVMTYWWDPIRRVNQYRFFFWSYQQCTNWSHTHLSINFGKLIESNLSDAEQKHLFMECFFHECQIFFVPFNWNRLKRCVLLMCFYFDDDTKKRYGRQGNLLILFIFFLCLVFPAKKYILYYFSFV